MDSEPEFSIFRVEDDDFNLDFEEKPPTHSANFEGNSQSHLPSDNQHSQGSNSGETQSQRHSHPLLKAFNPLERFQNLPEGERNALVNMYMTSKRFPGIRGLFDLEDKIDMSPDVQEFFGGIDPQIFKSTETHHHPGLSKLFVEDETNQQLKIAESLNELDDRISEVHKKVFSSISFNKTIGPAFFDHFQNFAFLQNESSFVSSFSESIKTFVQNAKKIRGPSIELILAIYDFWMRSFRDMVNEIWKHSEKFALNFFKKQRNEDDRSEKSNQEQNNEFRSGTSSTFGGQKEKRKQWSPKEIDVLSKMIDCDTIFSNDKLKYLAQQFGRTTSSITSKIQKILKEKKMEEGPTKHADISIVKKISEILASNPGGLNKDQVIQRLGGEYEMGPEDSWKKSVTQLLSSHKEFRKRKGVFSIVPSEIASIGNSNKTFKDRVAQCLLQCANYEGDLKMISEKYLDLYGLAEGYHIHDIEKIKTLEANISKTLCRYGLFDKSRSRTLYFYQNGDRMDDQASQIDSYIS